MGIPSEEFVTQTTQTIEVDGLPQGDAASWVLVLAWLRNAPERTGQSTVLHGTSSLGRGSGEHTVRFTCARPNRRAPTGELTNPELSRKQLTFEVRPSGVQITNEGRRPLRVNGKPSQQAQLTHGDVIEVDRVLLAVLVRRAPWPAVDALEDFPFGAVDSFGIVGESVAAWTLRARVQWCGRRSSHTLVTGPSGSGKELTASALHAHSARASEPFVARNATTLPESLLDAELFGHAANYPQSGMPARPGLVGAADRGTLFLDEIGELPAAGQAHLLRLLDSSGEYHRLGETRVRHADVRVIAATNRDPESLRHDLLPRFLLRVHVPGLQARREDIPLLVRYLSEEILRGDAELAATHGPGGIPVDCTFLSAMLRHEFTHHVRELASLMWLALGERPEVLALTPAVEARIQGRESTVSAARAELPDEPEVRAALAANEGNRTHAAEALGISRFALLRLLKRFDS